MVAKVLTLEQALQHGRGPIWLQEKGVHFAQCVMYDLEHSPYLRFKICTSFRSDRHLKYRGSEYGKTWRCFDVKPSEFDLNRDFEEDDHDT